MDLYQSERLVVNLLRSHTNEESVVLAAIKYAALVCGQFYRLLAGGEAVLDFVFRKNFEAIIKNQSVRLTPSFRAIEWRCETVEQN